MPKDTPRPGADHPRQSDADGVDPSSLGPAQPRPVDHDHDQVPTDADAEQLSEDEHLDLARAIERQRDA